MIRHSGTVFSAVKAVTAAQLSMASHGVHSVTLDEAIEAMRLTASDMSVKYKETSLSVRGQVCLFEHKHSVSLPGARRSYHALETAFSLTKHIDHCQDTSNRSRLVSHSRPKSLEF